MIRRLLLTGLACVTLAASAWPNGCYIPEVAYPDRPKIPLQRAVIVHRDGVETLIVESAFESPSPSVAWILPLPTEPTKLDVADPGICKSLSMCLRPRIVHDLQYWWTLFAWIAGLLTPVVLVLTFVKDHRRRNALLVGLAIIYVLIGGFVLPALGHARLAGLPGAVGVGVEVKAFERVGNYDVAVLRAKDAEALSDWLREALLQPLDVRASALVDDYIKRGWCFAVARLRREAGGPATPHPISATFPAERPVYPLKLTSLAESTTRVELFVIARETADAERFHRVTSDMFGRRGPSSSDGVTCAPWYASLETGLVIGNPDAGELMWGGCVVTHLAAELTPRQMDSDVGIGLSEMKPHRDVVFSTRGRRELVRTVLLCGAVAVLLVSAVLFRSRRIYRWWKHKVVLVLAALVLLTAGVVRVAVPVVPVRAGHELGRIRMHIRNHELTLVVRSLAGDGRLHAGMTTPELSTFPDMLDNLTTRPGYADNPFTGEKMRFERTPGNFSTRTVDNVTCFCLYDADCREYRVALPPAPAPKTEGDIGTIIVTHTPEVGGEEAERPRETWARKPSAREKAAFAAGRKLLDEGRWDEALEAYGGYGTGHMGEDLLERIVLARREGRTTDALRLYDVYFDYFPFGGGVFWRLSKAEWLQAATGYVLLLEGMPEAERTEQAARDVAVIEPFKRLIALARTRDDSEEHRFWSDRELQQTINALADKLIASHPRTRACTIAVMMAAYIAPFEPQGEDGYAHDMARGVKRIEELLARMQDTGVPRRTRVLVLWHLTELGVLEGSRDGLGARDREAYLEIARTTTVPYEKRNGLLAAAETALDSEEAPDAELGRKLFEEFLEQYPSAPEVDSARDGLVRTYLGIEGTDAALAVLRDLEKKSPAPRDDSLALFSIAESYRSEKKYDRSLALLKEIVEHHPKSMTAARALMRMGDVHGDAADEEKMVGCYREAAALLPPDADYEGDISARSMRNHAYQFLSGYYVNRGRWAEGLKWSEAWAPYCWCGNCWDAYERERNRNIATCHARLAHIEETFRMMEELARDAPWEVHKLGAALVDGCRGKGTLDEVTPRLREASADTKYKGGPEAALKYIELLELTEKKDLEALWLAATADVDPLYRQEWQAEAASLLLASLGDDARPFLLDRLKENDSLSNPATLTLARMKAPEVLVLLKEKADRETDEYTLRKVFTALALFGTDDAYAVIEHCAEEGTDARKNAASRVLREHRRPSPAHEHGE